MAYVRRNFTFHSLFKTYTVQHRLYFISLHISSVKTDITVFRIAGSPHAVTVCLYNKLGAAGIYIFVYHIVAALGYIVANGIIICFFMMPIFQGKI